MAGPALPGFKDRRAGLIAFGVVEIVIGALCALLVPLVIFSQAMAATTTGGEVQLRILLPALVFYLALAVVFVLLGIGSLQARRWARALSLIVAWSWLVVGVVVLGMFVVVFPKVLAAAGANGPGLPEAAGFAVMLVMLAVFGAIFVVLPGGLVVFYQSRHVKATCEARDPVVRWTDRFPLPVLGLSLWLLYGGVAMLLMPAAYHGVMPLFGVVLSGVRGALVCLVLAALWLYLAWGTYRLNRASWWLVLAAAAVIGASAIVSFGSVDWSEMYRAMGYPEAQIAQIEKYQFLQGSEMVWGAALGVAAVLACLCYVKRFFERGPVEPHVPGQA